MSGMSWLHSADGEMIAAAAADAADKKETGAAADKSELVVAVAGADAAAPALEATGIKNGASAEKNASAAGGGEGARDGEIGLGVKGSMDKETAAVVEVFKGLSGGGAVGNGAKKAAFVVPLQYNLAKAGTLFHQQVLLASTRTRESLF